MIAAPQQQEGYWETVQDYTWRLFGPFIESWNSWLSTLERKQDLDEKQIGQPIETTPTFPSHADVYIEAFTTLHIDIVQYVRNEKKLPDPKWVHKQYLKLQLAVHPDRGGTSEQSTKVNLAKQKVDELYDDTQKQILFLSILVQRDQGVVVVNTKNQQHHSTASYVSLFFAGALLGSTFFVYVKNNKKRK
jgi:hypothetical protein